MKRIVSIIGLLSDKIVVKRFYKINFSYYLLFIAPYKQKRPAVPARGGSASKQPKMSTPSVQPRQDNKDFTTNTKMDNEKSSSRDDTFRNFRRICADVANASAYTEKTAIVKKMFTMGPIGGE